MTVRNIKRVAYAALNTRDVDRMSHFYQDTAGLTETERDEQGNAYLRCDAFHHALVLMPSDRVGMHHYGVDTGNQEALAAAARRLSDFGSEIREVPPLSGQRAAIEVTDPAGNRVRLIGGTETVPEPTSVRAVRPTKFGHLNNLSPSPLGEVRDFYVGGLDFRVSDWFLDRVVWFRCNPDHHGVAYGSAPHNGMQHLCFEVSSMAHLAHQADHLVRSAGRTLLWGPGRHGPGNNLFIYFQDPERNVVEFTAEVEQVWDDENREQPWNPKKDPHWANQWGPEPSAEFLANMAPGYEQ